MIIIIQIITITTIIVMIMTIILTVIMEMIWYTLFMQRFRVVYRGVPHESLVFSWFTHELLSEFVYQKNWSHEWDIPRYTTRKRCITVSYHVIENTNNSSKKPPRIATHDGKVECDIVELHWSMGMFGGILTNIKRLSSILIGCILHGMV